MILIYLLTGSSFLLLLITGIQGYAGFDFFGVNHPTFGFFTAILYLLTEVLVMFFFVGTGVSIKEYIQEKGGDVSLHHRSVAIKRKLYPPTLLNLLLVMTLFVIGGGVDTHTIPTWLHGGFFLVSLIHFGYTIGRQHTCFKENTALILDMVEIGSSQYEKS